MDRNNSDIYKDAHYIISDTDDFNLIFDNNVTSIIGDEENMPSGNLNIKLLKRSRMVPRSS